MTPPWSGRCGRRASPFPNYKKPLRISPPTPRPAPPSRLLRLPVLQANDNLYLATPQKRDRLSATHVKRTHLSDTGFDPGAAATLEGGGRCASRVSGK
jgi:hypothetical protein